MTEKVSCAFLDRMLAAMSQDTSQNGGSFLNEDTFAEHLESANSKSIKEILRMPLILAAMGGQNQLLTESLATKIQSLIGEITG